MKARCEMLVENVWDKLWKLFTVFHLTRNKRVEMGRAADMLREIRYTEISEETKEFLRKNCLLKNTFPKTIFEALDQLQSENPDKEFVVLATKNATVNRLNICVSFNVYFSAYVINFSVSKIWKRERNSLLDTSRMMKWCSRSFTKQLNDHTPWSWQSDVK